MECENILLSADQRLCRKDAAAYLGFAPKSLANWSSRGLGPRSIRIAGRRFYYRTDLDAFIQQGGRDAVPSDGRCAICQV